MSRPAKIRPKAKCRILIVDDHPMTLDGLSLLIGGEPDLEICGSAAAAAAGLEAALRLTPDLVLTDISLPGKNGLEMIKDIHAVMPDLPVLVISMHPDSVYAERALAAGSRGYLMKSQPGDDVLRAIRTVMRGGISVSESISNQILQRLSPQGNVRKSGIPSLTNREFEIFQLLAEGLQTSCIAERLCIATKTVHTHLSVIKIKLGKKSLHELIACAAAWAAGQA